MSRTGGPKVRAGGRWTESRFNSFIKGQLRSATRKWAPFSDALKSARLRRGEYLCNGCKEEVPASIVVNGKRVKNALVDHIEPIVDPNVGFTTWDEFIDRLFCEEDNLQVLCHECHTEKTNEERAAAKERREREKDL